MNDTIYREQAIDAVDIGNLHPGIVEALQNIISELPSAEKTGKWTKIEYADEVNGYLIPNYECSQCKYWSIEDYDYCPNCGALMQKDGEA